MSGPFLRIALISEHASPLATIGGIDSGGQNIYVANVARALARAGHHVDVFTRRDDAALAPIVDMRPGVRVIHITAGPASFVAKEQLLGHMGEFTRACEQFLRNSVPYDVVHANFFMSGLVAMRLKESLGLPFVMTFHALGAVRREHQAETDGFPASRIGIERAIVRYADTIVAECPQDEADLVRLYDADPDKIAMVPCGFDPAEFSPIDRQQARSVLGLHADDFIVLQLGRLVPRKGIDNVIRAVGRLDVGIPARLLVVGGDEREPNEERTPEIARLRRVAADSRVSSKVQFVGHRSRAELGTFYAAADVFVTTPWYEPFGITPLEAMACGTPVIGSDVGGIKYSVEPGVTGFLVPPRDPYALAQRLAELHANPAMARAFGRAGIRRTRSMFTWERVAENLAKVYEGVLMAPATASVASPVWRSRRPGSPVGTVGTPMVGAHAMRSLQGIAAVPGNAAANSSVGTARSSVLSGR
ncbi:MAG: glycosyl transferase family 1 [Rhizobacter sp.]|nr:glycosyl transferase family 1 [Rhizobacter sp.]